MEGITLSALIGLGTALVAGAASYGGVRTSLNGTRKRVENIDRKMDLHIQESRNHREETIQRITAVETRVDHIKDQI